MGGIVNTRTGLSVAIRITRPDFVYRDKRNDTFVNLPILVCGVPVTVPMIDVPGGGNSRDVRFPNLLAGVNPFHTSSDCRFVLNPPAFSVPASGISGNLGRAPRRGPGMTLFDLTLQ